MFPVDWAWLNFLHAWLAGHDKFVHACNDTFGLDKYFSEY